MNREEVEGRARAAKGKTRKAAGGLTDDERLRQEGVAEERSGEIEEGVGCARRKAGETVEDIGEKMKR